MSQKNTLKKNFSDEFRNFCDGITADKIPLSKIVEFVQIRGHSLLLVLMALPFMLPIPLPGLSILFGSIIFLTGSRIAMCKGPWLPKSWLRREVSAQTAKVLFSASAKLLAKIEKLLKPRFGFLFDNKWTFVLDGLLLMIMGVVLALPLPPGTNFPPALSILCMGLGMLERDGLFVLLSYFFFCLNVLVFGAIAYYGYEGALKLLN